MRRCGRCSGGSLPHSHNTLVFVLDCSTGVFSSSSSLTSLLDTKVFILTGLQDGVVAVLKCAFYFQTPFPTASALNNPFRRHPNFWKWWVYHKSRELHFQVPVLGCCRRCFSGVAHPPHSWHGRHGNTGGHMDVWSCYSSCPWCVPGRGAMLLSCLSFHRSRLCLCYCCRTCEALTVLLQDRQFASILYAVAKAQ